MEPVDAVRGPLDGSGEVARGRRRAGRRLVVGAGVDGVAATIAPDIERERRVATGHRPRPPARRPVESGPEDSSPGVGGTVDEQDSVRRLLRPPLGHAKRSRGSGDIVCGRGNGPCLGGHTPAGAASVKAVPAAGHRNDHDDGVTAALGPAWVRTGAGPMTAFDPVVGDGSFTAAPG